MKESIGLMVNVPQVPVVLPKLPTELAQEIDEKVSNYVDKLIQMNVYSQEFESEITSIHRLGDAEIKSSSQAANRLLEKPAASVSLSKWEMSAKIPTDLQRLRETVEKLDPNRYSGRKRFLAVLPFGVGDSLTSYVKKHESAQGHLSAILRSLYNGQEDLAQTNISLEDEQKNLWKAKGKLEEVAYMVSSLEDHLLKKVEDIRKEQPELAKRLEEEALFYIRQKHQDVLTQIAVDSQALLAIDVIKKNNFELIKGVDRTVTTTVSGLRTAIIIARALANQKSVLTQVAAINGTASKLLTKTSEAMKEQSEKVHDQSASSTIDPESLKEAFNNAYQSLDSIDTFRVQALATMKKTVDVLSRETTRAQAYLKTKIEDPQIGE